MTDFSLIGYENVNVQEYLPILDKIKHDLNLLYDFGSNENRNHADIGSSSNSEFGGPSVTSNSSQTLYEETGYEYYSRQENPSFQSQSGEKVSNTIVISDLSLYTLKMDFDTQKSKIEEKEKIIKCFESERAQMEDEIKQKDVIIEEISRKFKSEPTNANEVLEEKNKLIEEKEAMISNLCNQIENERAGMEEEIKQKEAIIEDISRQLRRFEKVEVESKDITEIENLRLEIEENNETIRKLEKKTEKLEYLKNEIGTKNEIIEGLETEIKEMSCLQAELEDKNNKISSLQNKLKTLKSDESQNYQTLAEKLKSKRMELRERDSIYSKLESKYEALEEKCQKLDAERKSLGKQLTNLKEENVEYESKMEEYERQVRTLRKQVKELERKGVDDEEKDKYVKEIEAMKIAINGKTKEKEKLCSEYNDFKRLKDAADKKIKQLESDIARKDKEHNDFQEKIKTLENLNQDLEEKIKKKQIAMETMKNKIKETQGANVVDSQEYRILKREYQNKDSELEQLIQKVDNYKLNLEEKYQENEIQKKENMKLKEELENLKRLNFNERRDQAPEQQARNGGFINRVNEVIGRTKPDKTPYPEWWRNHMK